VEGSEGSKYGRVAFQLSFTAHERWLRCGARGAGQLASALCVQMEVAGKASQAWGRLEAESELAKETRSSISLRSPTVQLGRACGAREAPGHAVVACMTVSSKHALIKPCDSSSSAAAVIADCSTNGTFVNGRRLPKGELSRIHSGDLLSLAGSSQADSAGSRYLVYRLKLFPPPNPSAEPARSPSPPADIHAPTSASAYAHGDDPAHAAPEPDPHTLAPPTKSPCRQQRASDSARRRSADAELFERLRRAEEKASHEESLRKHVESDFERVKKERNDAEKQYQQEKEWKEQAQSERNTLRERAATAESERTATVQEKEALSNSVSEERRARTHAESRAQEAEAIATELERKLDDAEIRAASYLRNWREIHSLYENVTAAMASTRTAANRMIDYLDSTSRSLPLPSAEPPPAGATGAQTAAAQVCPLLIIILQMVQK